jgi:hypothetical protein
MRVDKFWHRSDQLFNAISGHFPQVDMIGANWLWRQMPRTFMQLKHSAGLPGDHMRLNFCKEMARLTSVLIPGVGPQEKSHVLDAVDEIFRRADLVLEPGTRLPQLTDQFFESAKVEPALADFMHRKWKCIDEISAGMTRNP